MKVILRKRILLKLLVLSFMIMIFAIGWLFLDYQYYSEMSMFDVDVYMNPAEASLVQGESIEAAVIVFNNESNRKPVVLYVSNCPRYSVCSLSLDSAIPTFTTTLMVETSEDTPPGTYPISVFVVGGLTKEATTYYLTVKPIECVCSDWVNRGCGGSCGSMMYLSRVCDPRSCDAESRCAYNASCIKDFLLESQPQYQKAYGQKATFNIKITSINNFSDFVYLSTDSCPFGAVCKYSLNPVLVPEGGFAISELAVSTSLGAAFGEFNITTTGINNETINQVNSTISIN